eukprot:TRINITY_DN11413_c0_g1_i1.p1 TRINITY_DN11413_c0_g1~~TRINITY_DN11413_c0_g1_i1.p1  ORF type:complete len:690 (-),score=87.24 TRINITY_DN11413_c0_g1_i1:721-2790(-)
MNAKDVGVMDFAASGRVVSLSITKDGETLALGTEKHIEIWAWPSFVQQTDQRKPTVVPGPANLVRFDILGKYLLGVSLERFTVFDMSWRIHCSGTSVTEIHSAAWCPSESEFVFGTVDGKIHLYSAQKKSLIQSVEFAFGMVKGLAWDPKGSFLIMQTDTTAALLRAPNGVLGEPWQVVADLPTGNTDSKATVLRPCFDPTGAMLILPNFVHSSGNAITFLQSVDRDKQKLDHSSFLSHKECVTIVCAWCPVVFETEKETQFCVVAVGSINGTLTIWHTLQNKPVMILQGYFERAITDLCWNFTQGQTDTGLHLLACSSNSPRNCCMLQFPASFFGRASQAIPATFTRVALPECPGTSAEVTNEPPAKKPCIAPPTPHVLQPKKKTSPTPVVAPQAIQAVSSDVTGPPHCNRDTFYLQEAECKLRSLSLPSLSASVTAEPALPKTRVTCAGANKTWAIELEDSCSTLTGNSDFVALAGKSLFLLSSRTGRLLASPIKLSSPAHLLVCNASRPLLMCITCKGDCFCWDVSTLQQVHSSTIKHFCSPGESLSGTINENGVCHVAVAGNSFAYHKKLQAWVQLDCVQKKAEASYEGLIALQDKVLILEQSLANAAALANPQEYLQWLKGYWQALVVAKDDDRLREIWVDVVLGPQCAALVPRDLLKAVTEEFLKLLPGRLAEELKQIEAGLS